MKRLLGIALVLVLLAGMILPTLAIQTEEPEEINLAYFGYSEYDRGYDEGYEIGWEEGNAQAIADKQNGVFAPKYHYDVFSQEEPEETYEGGYNAGLQYGYWRGYANYYFQEEYDAGYALGQSQALEDYGTGSNREDAYDYPDDTAFETDAEYFFAVGRYEGYWAMDGQLWYADWQAMYQEERNDEIKAAGGTVGQINVMLNGRCIAFPDAVPEFQNERTMVPVRAICEAMGASVEFLDGDVVQITLNGTVLNLTIGGETVTVQGGESIQMDCASYEKNGRTYVPVRFVSQALGLEVYWDEGYNTVVLFDKAAFLATTNSKFSIYQQIMEKQMEAYQGNKRISSKFNLSLVMLDSIEGNKTYDMSGDMTMELGGGALVMSGNIDLRGLVKLMQEQWDLGSDADMAQLLKLMDSSHSFQLIIDPAGNAYLQMPLMTQLLKLLGGAPVGTKDTVWYPMPAFFGEAENPLVEGADLGTIGDTIVSSAEAYFMYGGAFDYYDTITQTANVCEEFFGDARFKKSGNRYTLSMDIEDIIEATGVEADEENLAEMKQMLPVFTVGMSFDLNSGAYDESAAVQVDTRGLYYYDGSVMRFDMTSTGGSTGGKGSFSFRSRNSFDLTGSSETSITKTTRAPDYTLPSDAQIFENSATTIQAFALDVLQLDDLYQMVSQALTQALA